MFAFPSTLPPDNNEQSPIINEYSQTEQYNNAFAELGFDIQKDTTTIEYNEQNPLEQAEVYNEMNKQFSDIGDSISEPFRRKKEFDDDMELETLINNTPKTEEISPPDQEEILKNLREIKQRENEIDQELSQARTEKMNRINENQPKYAEARRLEGTADEMERISGDIREYKGDNSRNFERFENEFNVRYEDSPDKISEYRENAAEIRLNLKEDIRPFDDKIEGLEQIKEQNLQDYQNQLEMVSNRTDSQEIMDKWENEYEKTRDVTRTY